MVADLFAFQKELSDKGVIFCFNGPTSQEILVSIGDVLQNKMRELDTELSVTHRVFSVFVEQMQNIIRYSAEKVCPDDCNELRLGIIAVGKAGAHYYVICGNRINNKDKSRLEELLDKINRMNQDELKVFYKERRKLVRSCDSKGAGLGFIEIARKASTPIEFSIVPIDKEYSFFSLKSII